MYQTIEAIIENGRVRSPELHKLPAVAHVLITWIQFSAENQSSDFSDLEGALKWTGDAVKGDQ